MGVANVTSVRETRTKLPGLRVSRSRSQQTASRLCRRPGASPLSTCRTARRPDRLHASSDELPQQSHAGAKEIEGRLRAIEKGVVDL